LILVLKLNKSSNCFYLRYYFSIPLRNLIEKTINYHKNGFFGTVKYSHRGPNHYGTNIKKHYKQVSFIR
jgi:hypothetical protein